jgi:hypothetical protein
LKQGGIQIVSTPCAPSLCAQRQGLRKQECPNRYAIQFDLRGRRKKRRARNYLSSGIQCPCITFRKEEGSLHRRGGRENKEPPKLGQLHNPSSKFLNKTKGKKLAVRFFPFALPIFTATTARETTTNPSRKPHNSFRNRAETPQKNTNINFRRRSGSNTSISKDRLILPEDMFPESFSTRAIRRKQQRKTNNPSTRSKTPFRTPFSTISKNFFQDFATPDVHFHQEKKTTMKEQRTQGKTESRRGREERREREKLTKLVWCDVALLSGCPPARLRSLLGSRSWDLTLRPLFQDLASSFLRSSFW